jgi:hypothetical protein
MGVGPEDTAEGDQLEPEFQNAVKALQNYLAQNEPQIYQDLACGWSELHDAQLVISKNLGLEVSLPDGSVVYSACDAHLNQNPLTIYLRTKDLLFGYESGGRIISQCFKSYQYRHMVSLAWYNPSVRSSLAATGPMELAEKNVDDGDTLERIQTSLRAKIGVPIAPARLDPQQKAKKTSVPTIVVPRKLKSFDSVIVSGVDIINASSTGGKLRPSRKPILKEPGSGGGELGDGANRSAPRGYTDNDREQLALQLLTAVVAEHRAKLKDFTKLKSIGADIGDGVKQFFEVKAYGSEMPDVVNIEMSEVLRARKSGKDFYLAVISGLEEGYPTVIKLFAKPLDTLDWTKGTSIKLAGIKSKKSLEIRLDTVEAPTTIENTSSKSVTL